MNKFVVTFLAVLGLLVGASGCSSTKGVYRASATAKVTADTVMTSWGHYVKQFHPPLEQETQVKMAFEQYQAAQLTVLNAAIAYRKAQDAGINLSKPQRDLNAAVALAASALSDLIGLVQRFGVRFAQP
jgi:ABC-type glycerol-3-phosphate transport system substrate-binding protein